MRPAALLVLAAACTPDPTHLLGAVTIEITTDDPATAVVSAAAQAYVWESERFDVRDMVSGIDTRVDFDGVVVPLAEDSPGYLSADAPPGFPARILLLGDDEVRELDHSASFRIAVETAQGYIRVTLDPPVQDGEQVSITQYVMPSGIQNEPVYPGMASLDFPSVRSRFEVQRRVSTVEDEHGLRMGGTVRVTRGAAAPCLFGEACP